MKGLAIDVISVLEDPAPLEHAVYHSTNFLIEIYSERADLKAFRRLQTLLEGYEGCIDQDEKGRLYLTQHTSQNERVTQEEKEKQKDGKDGKREVILKKMETETEKKSVVIGDRGSTGSTGSTGSKDETWKESPMKSERRKRTVATLTNLSDVLAKMKWLSLCNNNRLCKQVIACIGKNEKGNCAVFFYDSVSNSFVEQPTSAILRNFNLVAGVNKITIYNRTDFVKEMKIMTPTTTASPTNAMETTTSVVDGGLERHMKLSEVGEVSRDEEKSADDVEQEGVVMSEGSIGFNIFTYKSSDKLVVMDIDGTVTISDVRGYFESVFLGVYSYVHQGVVSFLNMLEETYQLKIIFLTSRPLSHYMETKALLRNVRDTFYEVDTHGKKGKRQVKSTVEMPEAPVFCNLTSISSAVYGELIAKTTVSFKSGVLLDIKTKFRSARGITAEIVIPGNVSEGESDAAAKDNESKDNGHGASAGTGNDITNRDVDADDNVFAFGIGNKDTDMQAYQIAGISPRRCFLIGTDSKIRILDDSTMTNGATSASNDSNTNKKSGDKKARDMNVFTNYVDENLLSYVDAVCCGVPHNLIDNDTENDKTESGNDGSDNGIKKISHVAASEDVKEANTTNVQANDAYMEKSSKDPQKRVSLSLGVKMHTMDR